MNKFTLKDSLEQAGRTRKTKRWLGWLSFCMMVFIGQLGLAQVSIYEFSQSSGTFTSIATDGDLVPGTEATTATTLDTTGWTVNLPFTFNFNNNDYTSIYVNSNGGATFGATTSTASALISATTAFEGAIGVMNRDLWGVFITSGVTTVGSNIITNVGSFHGLEVGKLLNAVNGIPANTTVTAFDEVAGTITMSNNATSSAESAVIRYGTGKVFTKTEGTAPNRVFIIEWYGFNDYGTTITVSNFMSFQLHLAETTNAISVVYGDYFNVSTTNRTNQIGLRGATAADFNNRAGDVGVSWNSTTAGTVNNATVSRDNTNFPASGLTFTWVSPTCLIPANLTATNITVNSADLGWTEQNSATSWDIEWGLQGFTPTGTPSVGGEGVTQNPFTLGGLDTNTKYEFYVRSDCGTDDGYSLWAGPFTFTTAFDCNTFFGEITSTTGGAICDEGNATLQATAGGTGDAIFWYDAPTGGNKIGEGTTVETPFITETTSFWATEVVANIDTLTGIGIVTPSGTGTNGTVNYGMQFSVTEPTTLVSVDVLSTATGGDLTIGLYDVSNSTYIASHTEAITGGNYHTITLNFDVPAAGTYRLVRQAQSATITLRSQNTTGVANPYPIGTIGQIDGGHTTLTGAVTNSQYMFYNWSFLSEEVLCESARVEAVATVHKIEVSASELIIDEGNSTTLSVTSNNPNFTYEWTWDGNTTPLTGDSVIVSPIEHTTYILTATDSTTNCEISQEIEILVYDMSLCTSIEITDTTDGSVCDEGTVTLSATSSNTGSEIYWFDAPTGGNKVGQGAAFETPSLTSTTSYWASEVYLDGEEYPGQAIVTPTGTGSLGTTRQGLVFEVFDNMTIVDVEVYSTGAGGPVDIELYDNSNLVVGNHLYSVPATIPAGTTTSPTMHKITLNFELTPGTYRIVRAATPTVALHYIGSNGFGSYPIPLGDGLGQITIGANNFTNTLASAYYYFYNWTISSATTICESDREEVVATVHETIGINVTATETELLPGESTTLSVSSTNTNYAYEWTWDGGSATGASVTVSPTAVSTIYTVTATDTVTGCQTQGSVEIFTFDAALCDDLEIATTTDGSVCGPGTTTTLQATGNSGITDAQIFWYDAPTGGNKVGTGATFTTPALSSTTSYYAAEVITDGGGVGGTIQTSYTTGGLTFFAATNGVGITFAVQNTNSVPVTLDGLDFYMDAGTNQSYQLWYNATSITGIPGIINAANGWVSIAGPLNVAPTGTVNGIYPVFTGIDFEIPANTTYRFVLTGTGAGNFSYYNDAGTPNSFSSEGINLLVGANSAGSTGNVGYSGQNPYTTGITTTPRHFHGALSFNSANILCESDREEVTATVHDIIGIDVTATETIIDLGDSTTLTATSTNTNYEYVWTWDDGVGGTATDTGASIVVSPTEHTTYTVTATDPTTSCHTTETIEILVYDMSLCDTMEIVSTTDGSVCDEGTVTLSATSSNTGSEIYWYDAAVDGNKVGQGATFTTPNLTSTTSYWAAEVYLDGDGGFLTGLGQIAPSQAISATSNSGLYFTATDSFTLISVEVFSNTAAGGLLEIALQDANNGNAVINTFSIMLPPGGSTAVPIPVTVPLNFDIVPGSYRLMKTSTVGMAYNGATTGAPGYPYPLGDVGVITGSNSATLYYYFYNWTISAAGVICESEREEATATVHEIIDIDVTATATIIDFGESTTISVSSDNTDYTYVWTWGDTGTATGNTLTVSPIEHTTYTVTATDTVTGCQNVREIEILVYDMSICDDLEILTTTGGSVCDEGTVTLSATVNGAGNEIYWFDAPTGGNKVGQGNTFTTPSLTSTTSYWASEVYLDGNGGTLTGLGQPAPSQNLNSTTNGGLFFTATDSFTLISVEVFSSSAAGGPVEIGLRDIDNGNVIVASTTITLPPGGSTATPIPVTVPLNFSITPGNYRLVKESGTGGMAYNGATTGAPGFPYLLGDVGTITGGATVTGTTTLYYFYYNWTISAPGVICESEREEAVATVHEIIDINISATASTIDPGDNTTLTVSSDNPNYTYEWTWVGGTPTEGETITVFPTDHTTYTVTATDTVTGCIAVREIKIYVYDTALCNVLEVTGTTDGGICEEGSTVLYATGSGNGNNIFWFDAPTGGNKVGQGTSFTTPSLTSTTSYWATEVLLEADSGQVNLGPLDPSIGTSSVSNLTNHGMHFTVLIPTSLVSVEIFPTAAIGSSGTIEIREGNAAQTGTIVATIPYTTTVQGTLAAPVSQTVMIDVPLQPGNYILTPGVGINLIRNTTGASYPYTSDLITITGNTFNTSYWYWFYNWQFGSDTIFCESDREEAVALVVPASTTPAPTGPSNQLVYAGTTLAGLDVTGDDLAWYSDAALTNPIPDTTLAYEVTYYVTQTLGYCEGAALAITVALHCPTPSDLGTGTVTLSSAVLTWTGNGISSDIQWGPVGFALGTGTQINDISGTSYLLDSGLAPDSYYDFYVRQDCDVDGISNWGGPYTLYTGYCIVTSTSTAYGIGNFTTTGGILNINNSSGPGSYSNYTSQAVAQFVGGSPVQFTITSANSTAGMGVWIDWNNNMVFDAGEQVYNSAAYVASGSGTINIPAGTPVGNYRMRVVANFLSQNPTSCGFLGSTSSIYGEAEDYTFMVIDPPACMPVINPIAVNISATSVALSWTSDGTVFEIEYGPAGFTPGTGAGIVIPEVGNPYTLGGLTGGMNYQYYVRRDCTVDDDGYSLWNGPVNFTPGVFEGNIPTLLNANPQVDDIACANLFAIDVPAGKYLASLNVQYIMTSSNPAWDTHQRSVLYSPSLEMGEPQVSTHPDPQNYPGLGFYNRNVTFANGTEGPTTIEFQLKAWRTEGGSGCGTDRVYVEDGSWILNATFEDIPSCPNPPTDLDYSNITADSVDLIWSSDEAGTFQVKWGDVGFDVEDEGTTVPDINGFMYHLSGLDSSIQYEFYVRRDCSTVEEDFGEWIGPVRFNSGHCIPYATQGFYFNTFITTNAVENATYTFTFNPSEGLGTGYVNTNMIITEEAGESFNFTSNYVGGASGLRIWVDWNNDFVFADDEEVYFVASGSGNKSGEITIPAGTLGGDYRMRVRAQQGGTSTPPACGLIPTGEALDFTLRIPCDEVVAPTGADFQYFTAGQTLADLDVTGTELVWYEDEDLSIVLDESTELVHNTTYYVVNIDGNCQSEALAVTVEDMCFDFAAPTGNALQYFTAGQTLADLVVTGDDLVWYEDEDLTIVLDPTTELVHLTTYYVVSENEVCQSEALAVTVELTSSVSDFNSFGFRYYPNPVSEQLYLSANAPISNVKVINMLGQQVNAPANSDNTNVDMSGLPTGNYLIQVTIEGVSKILKIVKK